MARTKAELARTLGCAPLSLGPSLAARIPGSVRAQEGRRTSKSSSPPKLGARFPKVYQHIWLGRLLIIADHS